MEKDLRKSINIRNIFILLFIFFILFILLFYPTKKTYDSITNLKFGSVTLNENINDKNIEIIFTCHEDNFGKIELLFATYGQEITRGTVEFKLSDYYSGKVLSENIVNAASIKDNQYLSIEFDKQKSSRDKTYRVAFHTVNCIEPITVWANNDAIDGITTLIDGVAVEANPAIEIFAVKNIYQNTYYLVVLLIIIAIVIISIPKIKKVYKRNYILIGMSIIICSILPIFLVCKDSINAYYLTENNYNDFTNVYKNSCEYIGNNTFQIIGDDPFFVIGNINSTIRNVEIEVANTNNFGLAIYYDDGLGFSEAKSQHKSVYKSMVSYQLNKNIKMTSLRIDFNNLQLNDTVTISSISTNKQTIGFGSMAILTIINFIFILVFNYLLRLPNIILIIMSTIQSILLFYCIDNILLVNMPVYIKLYAVIFSLLLSYVILLFTKELIENEDTK